MSPIDIILRLLGAESVRQGIRNVSAEFRQSGAAAKSSYQEAQGAAKGQVQATNAVAAASRAATAQARQQTAEIRQRGASEKQASDAVIGGYRRQEAASRAATAGIKQQATAQKQVGDAAVSASRQQIAAANSVTAANRAVTSGIQQQINANRLAVQEARKTAQAQKQAAIPQSGLSGKLSALNQGLPGERRANLENAVGKMGGLGMGMMGAAAAGGVVLGKGLLNADEIKRTRKSIAFSLGGDEGEADKRIGQLKEIDRNSSFDFQGLSANFNNLLGKGFGAEEAMDLMKRTGDVTARTQGGQTELTAIIRQFGQIRSGGRASMQDINAISEGGGLPIIKILESQLGQERIKGVMSGDAPLSSEEFFTAFNAGVEKYKGGMKEANDSLAGDLSNLVSALYQASEATNGLLAPVRTVVQMFTSAIDVFNGLPEPLKTVLSYGGAFGILAVGFGGLILSFLAGIGRAALGIEALKLSMDSLGNKAGATAIKTGVGGAVGAAGEIASGAVGKVGLAGKVAAVARKVALPIAAVAATAYGASKLNEGMGAAGHGTDKELEKEHGTWGKIWARGGKWVGRTFLGDHDTGDNFDGGPQGAAKPTGLKDKLKAITSVTSGPASIAGALTSNIAMSSASPQTFAASLPSTSRAGDATSNPYKDDIRSLEDQIRAAKGKENKERRDALKEQLITTRRASQDWNTAHRAQLKEARDNEREAKTAAKAAEKTSDAATKRGASENEAQIDADLDVKIARLEAAKEGVGKSQAKALDYQIALLTAQKNYRGEMARIEGMDDDDPAAKASARKVAQIKYDKDVQIAQIGRDKYKIAANALRAAMKAGTSVFGFAGVPSGPASVAGAGAAFNDGSMF